MKEYLGVRYLKLNSIVINDFNIKEYSPLINPRAHNIGNKQHNLANKEFKETYNHFLKYALEK